MAAPVGNDPESDVMVEFDFLVSEGGEGAGEASSDATDWGKSTGFASVFTQQQAIALRYDFF